MYLISDPNHGPAVEHELLVLYSIPVSGHPPAGLDGKSAHVKSGPIAGAGKYLARGRCSGGNRLDRNVLGMAYSSGHGKNVCACGSPRERFAVRGVPSW
jgi:hypothetical protein